MTVFPTCHDNLSPEIRGAIFDLGAKWASDPARPKIANETLSGWAKLIESWISDVRLPLFVRRPRNNRGACLPGPGNRTLVPTDNSPAQWAFAVAYSGQVPRLEEITDLLKHGKLPIAMALRKGERAGAIYTGIRGKCPSTSESGWKLAHIQGVKLGGRGSIENYPLPLLKAHFERFMTPRNMLVVPAEFAGLSEVPAFIEGYCSVCPTVGDKSAIVSLS